GGGEDVAMDEDEEWGGIGDEEAREEVVESVPNGEATAALDEDETEKKEGEASKPAKKKRRKAKKKT
ncbi:hypothetical protein V493_07762, partial [Pseudogymnoascus sp. VKM F-4281 (FW-2241)]